MSKFVDPLNFDGIDRRQRALLMACHEGFRRIGRGEDADYLPQFVYADWLDEHGQQLKAEFIRIQCRLSERSKGYRQRSYGRESANPKHPNYGTAELKREAELLSPPAEEFTSRMYDLMGWDHWTGEPRPKELPKEPHHLTECTDFGFFYHMSIEWRPWMTARQMAALFSCQPARHVCFNDREPIGSRRSWVLWEAPLGDDLSEIGEDWTASVDGPKTGVPVDLFTLTQGEAETSHEKRYRGELMEPRSLTNRRRLWFPSRIAGRVAVNRAIRTFTDSLANYFGVETDDPR